MNLDEAKRIIRGERASGALYVEDFQEYAQEQWLGVGVNDTWQDDAWHGVWWTLQALQSGDKKALECGKAYLELAMRERGEGQAMTTDEIHVDVEQFQRWFETYAKPYGYTPMNRQELCAITIYAKWKAGMYEEEGTK